MATLQYRLSSRVSNGKAEVLARFYDGSTSQRAKYGLVMPVLRKEYERQYNYPKRRVFGREN